MSYFLGLDGTQRQAFQLGGAGAGPVFITGVVWAPTSGSTYNPLVAVNVYDPTGTFLVPVRVGDAQQATDAVNLETMQAAIAAACPVPNAQKNEPGMYEGGLDGSPPAVNGSLYG